MLDLANLIAKIVDYNGQIIWDGSKPNGQPKRTLNTEKALGFGFKAHTSLFNGLNETYKWLKTIPA
jgi:GDP-L-fucose synthase